MPFGCLGRTFGVLGEAFGVIWGVLVARSASFGGPWWHFWPHLGCLDDTFGVIGAVLGRLGGQGPPKIEKVAIVASPCLALGGVFWHQNHTKNRSNNGAQKTHQNMYKEIQKHITCISRRVASRDVFLPRERVCQRAFGHVA